MIRGNVKVSNLIAYVSMLYFTLGQLEVSKELFLNNLLVIILNALVVLYLFFNRRIDKKFAFATPFVLIFLLLSFSGVGNNYFADIYRLNTFLSFFLVVIYFKSNLSSYRYVFNKVVNFYLFIAYLIVIDAVLYFIIGSTVFFNVMFYITPRFIGPFYDPNFLGFVFGGFFLLSIFDVRFTRQTSCVFFICVILSGSWIVIGLIFMLYIQIKLLKIKIGYTFIKPLFCIFVVISFWFIYYYYLESIYNAFVYLVRLVSELPQELIDIKFKSLVYRFEVTSKALEFILSNPTGFGYRTINQYLPLDTHNSYLGVAFEYGIGALSLIIIPFLLIDNAKCYTSDVLSSFICLMALFLNVHYMPLYLFFLLVCYFIFSERRGGHE